MALIMYLTKAPRYKNITTDEYENIEVNDLVLVDKYFNWKMERENGGKYSCDTLEEWCGTPESKLPHKYIVNYYREFFIERTLFSEIRGFYEEYSLFEHVARIAKANQIFAWFAKNVMHDAEKMKYYVVSQEQIVELFYACKKVVDEGIDAAKEVLPIMEDQGYFFGTDNYNEIYMDQVRDMMEILECIIQTTDFEKETIYINAIW